MHSPSHRLSEMQFSIIPKFRACRVMWDLNLYYQDKRNPSDLASFWAASVFADIHYNRRGSVLARQMIMSFHLLAPAAVSWDFFAITYEKMFIIKPEGEEGSNYGIDIENHLQAGLTIGMTAQHTILNTAFLSDSTLPGCAFNGVISLAGASFSAGIAGEPAFIQLSGKKSVEVYTIR